MDFQIQAFDYRMPKFVCNCEENYSGTTCAVKQVFCSSMPCFYGHCVEQEEFYKCHCPEARTGQNCQEIINICLENNPCSKHSECEMTSGSNPEPYCVCNPGYAGRYCTEVLNACFSNPCGQGVCIQKFEQSDGLMKPSFSCVCNPTRTGEFCDENVDFCLSSPCQRNSTCVMTNSGFECFCGDGYIGQFCQVKTATSCTFNRCDIESTCIEDENDGRERCVCPPNRTGIFCEILTACRYENKCRPGSTCELNSLGYDCICEPGWTGKFCTIDIDECSSGPCINGRCIDLINAYTCVCDDGWELEPTEIRVDSIYAITNSTTESLSCSIRTDICMTSNCNVETTSFCIERENELYNMDYVCECYPGYTGKYCNQIEDLCSSKPCRNGVCNIIEKLKTVRYQCECLPGFTGKNCESEIHRDRK